LRQLLFYLELLETFGERNIYQGRVPGDGGGGGSGEGEDLK